MNSYIGGEFDSLTSEAYQHASRESFDFYFPSQLNKLERHFFETGADSLTHILTENYTNLLLPLHLCFPEHYCTSTIERVKHKLNPDILFSVSSYSSLNDLLFRPNAVNIVLINHLNKYDPVSAENFQLLKSKNWLIIEDFVQAPFDVKFTSADYSFISLRKVIDVETSICYCKQTSFVKQPPSAYYQLKKEAVAYKSDFFRTGNKWLEEKYLNLFKEAETKLINKGIIAAQLLEIQKIEQIDWKAIHTRRLENYNYLSSELKGIDGLELLKGSYMYLMLKTAHRDALREFLFSHGVFPVIHWPDSLAVVSNHLLSLHIDQRYSVKQLRKVVDLIKEFYKTIDATNF